MKKKEIYFILSLVNFNFGNIESSIMAQIKFTEIAESNNNSFVILVNKHLKIEGEKARELDRKLNGAISNIINKNSFKGEIGEFITTYVNLDNNWNYIIIVGIGEDSEIDALGANKVGGAIYKAIEKVKAEKVSIAIDATINMKLSEAECAANIALGLLLKSYKFDKYFTKKTDKFDLKDVEIIVHKSKEAQDIFTEILPIYEATKFIRDLISEPSNRLYPKNYAEICDEKLSKLGIKVTILQPKDMEKLGMEALLGVGKGSRNEPRLVVMEYNGAGRDEPPVAFVGKGVTFDSGGISLKPALGMDAMKYDMSGSGAVVGTLYVLASRKAKVNAVGVIGLVENMPDGNAQKPGDVVKSLSGQTIEVLNTDAEGRLVLADAIWYCQEKFNPKIVVDLATLTGAIVVALADVYAGLFSNDDKLSEQLVSAGKKVGEPLWRFPLGKEYDKMIDSKVADVQNISNAKGGSSITAAQFIGRFVKEGCAWAHLDIAGMAWTEKDKPLAPVGATAFGIRLLNQLVSDFYEK